MQILILTLKNFLLTKTTLFVFLVCIFLPSVAWPQIDYDVTYPRPEEVPEGNELFLKGFLDITLYGADPTGASDSTAAINLAVKRARDYRLVCFFPAGTYLVSDTIEAMMDSPSINADSMEPCQLVGSTIGERPLIKLKANTPKFSDPSNPLPVFWFWAVPRFFEDDINGSTDPLLEQSNIAFDQVFIGINIDLSSNSGAIGIRHAGAQGAVIENVKVNAYGAFAGFRNIGTCGGGGGFNLEVYGGKYAVYQKNDPRPNGSPAGDYATRHEVLAGCTFKDQTGSVFYFYRYLTPFVLVGCDISTDSAALAEGWVGNKAAISMSDSIVDKTNGKMFDITDNNLILRNVYCRGVGEVANGWTIENVSEWTWIKEYSYSNSLKRNLVNGSINQNEYKSKQENLNIPKDNLLSTLVNQHKIPGSLPSFEDYDVINVKDASKMNGAPALGDRLTDDTAALEYAIDNYAKIFLPKGNYKISRTLTLKSNTQMFGASKTFTTISPISSWQPSDETVIVTTVDNNDATTSLAFLNVSNSYIPTENQKHFTPIEWRAGRNSIVRDVVAGISGEWNKEKVMWQNRFSVKANGGGRWFAPLGRWRGSDWASRGMLIENTSEPIWVYGFNAAGEPPNITIELKNASNVNFFYTKYEGSVTQIKIDGSNNVCFYGNSKNFEIGANRGGVEVVNSDNILVADFHLIKSTQLDNASTIIENYNSDVFKISADYCLGLFKRGEPTATAIITSDLNNDGQIDILDIQTCINVILETETDPNIVARADVNGDGSCNALDIQEIVNAVLNR